MKYISKLILCAGIVTIFVVGCDTKELHDLNINPQAVTTISPNFLFTPAQLAAAAGGGSGDNRYTDWRTNIGMCAYAIQQLANGGLGGIAPGDRYTDNFETAEAPFQFFYGDELLKTTEIIKQTSEGGYDAGNKQNLKQAARILQAFLYARATDYYGSVPYTEAEKGIDLLYFPKYDKQKTIYLALLQELDEASAALTVLDPDVPDEGFGAADLYYSGDITKWKKWGYSLMLRLAMKISNVDPTTSNTYVAKAIAGGVFTSNDDNCWVPMATGPSQWTNQNGISRAFYPGDGGQPIFMAKTLIDWLKGADPASAADDDPRLLVLSGGIGNWSVVNGTSTWTPKATVGTDPLAQRGMPNGMSSALLETIEGVTDPDAVYSKINIKMLDLEDPYMLMNAAEVEFLLAEAAERGIGGASGAALHFAAGVKDAMQMYTPYDASLAISDGAVATYLAAHPYVSGDAGLVMIGEQLWASFFLNWYEAWGDWRRSVTPAHDKGIPALTPVNFPGNVTGGTIPQRLKYPNKEVSGNPNFAATATNPNLYTTKVWWAGGPE